MLDSVSVNRYSNVVAGFTKLFSSLIFSTVWREEMHVKVVWITMLAMANRNGEVLASVPGLADAARVSLEQCQEALAKLAGPDEWSRTQEHEGRRIVNVDGGWRLLNYVKYRELRDADERRIQTRENVRRYRERKAESVTVTDVSLGKPKQKQRQKQTTTKAGGPRAEWVKQMCAVWKETYGGEANWGAIARVCQGLAATADPLELIARWQNYLQATPARYATVKRFVETYGSWDAPGGQSNGRVPEDEAARRFREAGLSVSQYPVRPGGYASLAECQSAIDKRLEVERAKSA